MGGTLEHRQSHRPQSGCVPRVYPLAALVKDIPQAVCKNYECSKRQYLGDYYCLRLPPDESITFFRQGE